MAARPQVAIVGPGKVGTTLALELARAGYVIREVISRNGNSSLQKAAGLARRVCARAATIEQASWDANIVWLCVPDGSIAAVARDLAPRTRWSGKVVFHSSGALSSDALDALRERGAAVASVHPLMTFVKGSKPSLQGVPFGVEGDAAAVRSARRVVRDLGGEVFRVQKKRKAAYHAWGTFASPLLLAALVAAEQVARRAGISATSARRKMLPIVRQTLANYAALGPAGAFSGPIVRGDVAIVRKHLAALKDAPELQEAYRALAKVALRYLPARNRGEQSLVFSRRSSGKSVRSRAAD